MLHLQNCALGQKSVMFLLSILTELYDIHNYVPDCIKFVIRLLKYFLTMIIDICSYFQRSRKMRMEPSPMVRVTVASKTLNTPSKPTTTNPTFEHNLEFLIHNPKLQDMTLEVRKPSTTCLMFYYVTVFAAFAYYVKS